MKWQGRQRSSNVETRGGGGKVAVGGLGIILVLAYTFLTGDPAMLLNSLFNNGGSNNSQISEVEREEMTEFVSVVLRETEVIWDDIFDNYGRTYNEPGLVLYTDSVQSACGNASSAVGPFYCSLDSKIYVDLSFYKELTTKYGAPGDFAMAYVLAHEVGHHVQNELGVLEQVNNEISKSSQTKGNDLSVRLELQADYLAGVFAYHLDNKGLLDVDDIDEAVQAAHSVGDDTLQKEHQGYVVPDSFTHGTSEQRVRWFKNGYNTGDLSNWDTFSANSLYDYYQNLLFFNYSFN